MTKVEKIQMSIMMGNWVELMKVAKELNQMFPGMGNKCLEEANQIARELHKMKNDGKGNNS